MDDTFADLHIALTLAEAHRLTLYDAVCLELAWRRNAALATLDKALAQAAAVEHVPLISALS